MQCFSCVMQSSGRHATIPSEKVGANLFVCVAPAAELPACVPPVAVGTASVALKPPLASSEVFDWLLRVNSTLSGAPASFAYMPAIPTAPILMVPTQAQHRPNTGPTQAQHRPKTGRCHPKTGRCSLTLPAAREVHGEVGACGSEFTGAVRLPLAHSLVGFSILKSARSH